MAIRSTTGCYTCKTRRKKCDETHPKCQRCIKSGIECSGYEYVESKGGLSKRRTRPAPRPASELARSAQATTTPDSQHSSVALEPARNLFTPHPALFPANHDHETTLNFDDAHAGPHTEPFEFSLSPESFAPDTPQSGSNLHLYAETPLTLSRKSSYIAQHDSVSPSYSLVHYSDAPRLPNPPPHITASWLLPGAEEDPSADEVREEMNRALHMVPRMDSSVQSNLLPFALQCYTNWMTSIRLDPSRLIRQTKDALVRQISSSENARARVMLISRAMKTLQDTITPGPRGVELVLTLKAGVQKRISSLKAQPRLLTQNRQGASEALENFLEILAVHNYSCSLSSLNDLMGSVAPMFRRACPEPPDTLVDLPNLMLQADVKLRHFAVVDVTLAIMTGRPMQFRYNIDFSMDLCESMSARNRGFGLEWLLGIPDQFILLLAWMNQLREDLFAGSGPVSEEIVARIERDMKNLKMYTSENESSDPVVRVWQLVVQECWRQVVYVYLYMGLCGATAEDPRVVKAHGAFLRLVGGIRPARKPDIFLIIPWGLVGMAATKQCDRDMLRERLMLQPEGRNAGACMNNALQMLEDVWERSGRENRPVVWGDLRIACLRVLGM